MKTLGMMSKNVFREDQRITYFLRHIIIVLYFNIPFIYTKLAVPLPLWTWDCVNDKCVPFKVTQTGKLQSLETCNMLCSSIPIWPMPTGHVSLARAAVPTRTDLFVLRTVVAPTESVHQHLRDAFELFRHDLRKRDSSILVCEECHKVLINIYVSESKDPRMQIHTDESYNFLLYPTKNLTASLLVNITALSYCGARHALETLLQLVWLDTYAGSLQILQEATIKDSPKFRYRGLMIDTANMYFPVGVLLRTIDAMAASKLNTFHWHVSDSQAFALQLRTVPELTKYGAYSQRDLYTTDQVRTIVRRAKLRGIRVLIEVDTPAHVGRAWDWNLPMDIEDLVHCTDSEPWPTYCKHPPCGQLNPTNSYVFKILQNLYSEIIELTGIEDIFHLGGSDISEKCWEEHFNESDSTDLWIDFTKSALQSLESANGYLPNLTLLWTSRLSERLKTDFIEYVHAMGLQTRNFARTKKYVSGLRAVISDEDSWDLNSGLGEWFEVNIGMPYNSWQRVYEHRPWVRGGIGNVEGGEATVWSRSITVDELDSRIWPRAAALAERLWSDRFEGVTRMVQARLDIHRTRLINRGVQVAPLWSNWCTQNTYTCI